MSLSTQHIEKLKQNIHTLSYVEGDGLFPHIRSQIRATDAYLIIGAGGVGIRNLCTIKQNLFREFNETDVRNKVRFLAIDTDDTTLRSHCSSLDYYLECIHLKHASASKLADPNNPKGFLWVHPWLSKVVCPRMGAFGWAAEGTGATRQIGRVKFCDPSNRHNVKKRIIENIYELNAYGEMSVHVIIIAGIAGGTGSGMIIDLPYLVRSINGSGGINLRPDRFSIEGYILLPPACGMVSQAEAVWGNRNAYAALKEIDYFMNLQSVAYHRSDCCYRLGDYATTENLFDNCTLVDGMLGDEGVVTDPVNLATTLVSRSIANFMKAIDHSTDMRWDHTNSFGTVQYLHNVTCLVETQVCGVDYKQFPREANYRFLAPTYSEFVIPIDLVKTYLFKKIIDTVCADFHNVPKVTEETVWEFLYAAGLELPYIRENMEYLPLHRLPDSAEHELILRLQRYGPMYMLELCKGISAYLTDQAIYAKVPHLTFFRNSWDEAVIYLRNYRALILDKYSKEFETYSIIFANLMDILEKDVGRLMDPAHLHKLFGLNPNWVLTDFSSNIPEQTAIRMYLDDLIPEDYAKIYADQFRILLVDERDRVLQLFENPCSFDFAQVIRDYAHRILQDRFDATFEDLLVKFFGQNPSLSTRNYKSDYEAQSALFGASMAIKEYFETHNSPLAQIGPEYKSYFTLPHVAYIVPRNSPNLLGKLSELFGMNHVYPGMADDRIICIGIVAGVSPYFYEWVEYAEHCYESDMDSVGLHMEYGPDFMNWIDYPNLIPEAIKKRDHLGWNPDSPNQKRLQEVRELISNAEKCGLVVYDDYSWTVDFCLLAPKLTNRGEYEKDWVVVAVKEIKDYISLHGKSVIEREGSDPNYGPLVSWLRQEEWLRLTSNRYLGSVYSPGCDLEDRKAYVFDLSAKLLRKSPYCEEHLRLTLLAIRELEEYIAILP